MEQHHSLLLDFAQRNSRAGEGSQDKANKALTWPYLCSLQQKASIRRDWQSKHSKGTEGLRLRKPSLPPEERNC